MNNRQHIEVTMINFQELSIKCNEPGCSGAASVTFSDSEAAVAKNQVHPEITASNHSSTKRNYDS
jgi:hypothetical protein